MTRPNPCAKRIKAIAAQPPTPAVDPTAFEALKTEVAQLRDQDRSRAKAIDDLTRRLDQLTSPSPYI